MADDVVTKIYGLCDPRDGELRYVGKTRAPLYKRLSAHFRTKAQDHKSRWLRAVVAAGLKPEIFVIEEVAGDGCAAEIHHIAQFRSIGCRLTNSTPGGDGVVVYTPEIRTRMSEALKKHFSNPANRAAQAARVRALPPRSAEQNAKHSEVMTAWWASRPRANKPRKSRATGVKRGTQEFREMHRRLMTPELRAQVSASLKAFWARKREGGPSDR